jgi:KaiC/GvpD/RAD55 family RecA-like ATPase
VLEASTIYRVSTGVPGLDDLIEGGFPANRVVLFTGDTGTGKSTFGLQFLSAGLERNEAGAFVSVDQKPGHLITDAAGFGWDLQAAIDRGTLALLDASPYFTATRSKGKHGIEARQISSDLTQQLREIGATRLVLDSVSSLVPPDMTRAQAHDYLRSLILSLEDNLGCTIILTARTSSSPDPQGICEAVEYLVSGVIELRLSRLGRAFVRTLFVKKMRGTRTNLAEYLFDIRPDTGVYVFERAP